MYDSDDTYLLGVSPEITSPKQKFATSLDISKLQFTENNNLMSFLKDQTKLMIDYAYCYQGAAKDFIPDVNYTKLKESINSLKTFDEDLVFKIRQIYSGVENDR